MKFGVREIANVVFRAKSNIKIGNTLFKIGQPVLYIDSAKTSTLEGAGTTVYAQGGRGNTRLVAWEGEKTLTFTVEDALLSPQGLSILSGAGLIKNDTEQVHVHMTSMQYASMADEVKGIAAGEIDLSEVIGNASICQLAPIFVMETDADGSLTGKYYSLDSKDPFKNSGKSIVVPAAAGKTVMVDFYIVKNSANVSEIQIDAEHFAGYYYVEADTLFRRQSDGVDMPANITLPNVKIQSNFTFSMASTGDPSTFTFTMDALPGYTYFNKQKKVLCVIQVVEDSNESAITWNSVMTHEQGETIDLDGDDTQDNQDPDELDDVRDSYPANPVRPTSD